MSYPHKEIMTKNSIAVTDLAEKTQKLIAKFEAETDEEKREAIDEKIFGDVEDFIEDKAKKEKMEKTKANREAVKADIKEKKKIDVSAAPTATPAPKKDAAAAPAPAKERTPLNTIFGR